MTKGIELAWIQPGCIKEQRQCSVL